VNSKDMTLGQDGDRSRYQAIVSFMYTYFQRCTQSNPHTQNNVSPYFENILSYKVTTKQVADNDFEIEVAKRMYKRDK